MRQLGENKAGWLWGTQVNRGAAEIAKEQLDHTAGQRDALVQKRDDAVREAVEQKHVERARAVKLAINTFPSMIPASDPDAGETAGLRQETAAGPEPTPLQRYITALLETD